MRTNINAPYWIVKVYDPISNTTTTIGKQAWSREDIIQDLAEDGYWTYVDAHVHPEED